MLKSLFSRRPALDVLEAMQQAWTFQKQGNLDAAEPLCRAVLRVQAKHFDALHLLGVVNLQRLSYDEAEKLLEEAVESNPNSADAHAHRGSALLGIGRPSDALASFEKALAINPELADVYVDRGAALHFLGRHAEALASYDLALKISPDFLPALSDRADVLYLLHRRDEAIAGYTKALVVAPDHYTSLLGLGHALESQDRVDEALTAYGRALAVRHDDVATLGARANALLKLGRHAEALDDWDRALAADPRLVPALVGRGNVLHRLGRSEEALAEFDKAIEASPDYAGAPYNRAIVLNELGRYDEAIAAYSWACAIKPDFAQALFNLGVLQSERNRHNDALASFEQVLATDPDYPLAVGNLAYVGAQICHWEGRDQVVQRVEDGVRLGKPVIVPFAFLALSQNAEAQRACAMALVAEHHPASPHPLWTGGIYRHDKIRVAYVSADFHDHALAYLIAGLLEQHDHERFEITGIALGPDIQGPMRSRIEVTFDRFVAVRGKSDAEAASVIRELEIDIAVNLMGFTKGSRTGIFALRPAPVQINYLGYPGTMGAEYMDYILADRFLIPEEQRRHYTEHVVYLPDTFQVNDAKRRIADVTPSRSDVGLPDEGFVFCSFNNSYKITPEMFAAWMRLLERVPGSVLWLIAGNAAIEANLRREAQDRGVAPARLVFAPRLPYPEHLARYRVADLFLDTLPFNAGTTASDALWAGLPVLTCAGEAFAARMAGSLLHAIGLPELITHSLAEYESLALQLATDAPRLAGIRQRLAANRDSYPLFDTDRFRRNVEAAYVIMWEKTQRGEPPESFAVPG